MGPCLRHLVVLLAAFLVMTACNGDLAAMDLVASRELKGCPERPGDPSGFAVRGRYRDHGEKLDYDRLVPPGDPREGHDHDAVVDLYRSSDKYEQLYHDASRGHPRASWLVCYTEVQLRLAGRNLARRLNSLSCQTVEPCTADFDKMPFSSATASGRRGLVLVGEAFGEQAEILRLGDEIVMNILAVVVGAHMARHALRSSGTRRSATPRGKQGCFPPDILVETPDRGRIPIKDVHVGDLVLAMDDRSRKIQPRKVSAKWHRAKTDMLLEFKVAREDNFIENFAVTYDHPMWVAGKGWQPARLVRNGARLVTRDGRAVWVLDSFNGGEVSEVYNLEVEGDHTFFIGHLGIWVHNKPMANPGPGKWQRVNESMSRRAAAYQKQISGRDISHSYVVDGVRFDGFKNDALLEAKGPGYLKFTVKGVSFQEWFVRGRKQLLNQARSQIKVAGDTSIVWHVAESRFAQLLRSWFKDHGILTIVIKHTPMP